MPEHQKTSDPFCFKQFKHNLVMAKSKTPPPKKEEDDWSKREIGALWKKSSPTQDFYSGKISVNGQNFEIVCYTNKHKSADNHPDIRIYTSKPRS